MTRQEAEQITTEYLKPVFGFALKRCKNLQDAEDLSQEIIMKTFYALLKRDDIEEPGRFIWRIARNALSNYYRDKRQDFIGPSIDDLADSLCGEPDITSDIILQETAKRLHSEIAYLSKLQRHIVIAYYYEDKKQSEIAKILNIPLGTVKWHLFEAKKELKRGMEMIRTSGELKFNPITFATCATNGSVGSKGDNQSFFRSALSQNIAYVSWKEPKTVNQIADELGVSPVYVESEAEYLEEYGFLTKHGDKYLCNILLMEATTQINHLQDEMYEKSCQIFVEELYDELTGLDIMNEPCIRGGYTTDGKKDTNFILWALIPYIAAFSGKSLVKNDVSFEDAATLRPDGGHNICFASISNPDAVPLKHLDILQHWSGPCWNKNGKLALWQLDSIWSGSRIDSTYHTKIQQTLTLLNHMLNGMELSKEEYAYLAQQGILKSGFNSDQALQSACQCVLIEGEQMNKSLIDIGDRIKARHKSEFDTLLKAYSDAVLSETPKHLQTMQKYRLQFSFYSNGWFILYCLKYLADSNKLTLPAKEQKKALSTVIVHKS